MKPVTPSPWMIQCEALARKIPEEQRTDFYTLIDTGVPFMDAFGYVGISFEAAHGLMRLRPLDARSS